MYECQIQIQLGQNAETTFSSSGKMCIAEVEILDSFDFPP